MMDKAQDIQFSKKNLIIFDLDNTLAESKAAIDHEMAGLLSGLLDRGGVAIISGGDWPQFEKQVLANLPSGSKLSQLSILPTCGTKFYQYQSGAWKKLYSEDFTAQEKNKILKNLQDAVKETGNVPEKLWGEQIEDRGSQITFSALGQHAPLQPKQAWDPDFAKRKVIQGLLKKTIPEFSVQLGGATSIDITKPGIDKAYGIFKLRDVLNIPIKDMLFIGDAIFEGGNDYPATRTGADCINVKDPEDTKDLIRKILQRP
ncbi:HAD-IIB family hydrolase [Pedobacter duraquae]|nr:HAD-IIB family hydrolase [Pedobacter duraquae]